MWDIFGEELIVVFGMSDEVIYFVVGKGCVLLLKFCMDELKMVKVDSSINS